MNKLIDGSAGGGHSGWRDAVKKKCHRVKWTQLTAGAICHCIWLGGFQVMDLMKRKLMQQT